LILASGKANVNHQAKVNYRWFLQPTERNEMTLQLGWTALIGACTNGFGDIVDLLLETPGIDVNMHDEVV